MTKPGSQAWLRTVFGTVWFLLFTVGCQHTSVLPDQAVREYTQDPSVLSETLPNGFSYYLRSGKSALRNDQIEVRLIVKTGSLQEREDEQGYSHLLEHLVYRGTTSFSAWRIESLLNRFGLEWGREVNATTHYGFTIYRFLLSGDERSMLPEILHLYSEFLHAVTFDPVAFETEKKVLQAEWLYRYGHKSFVVDPLVATALAGTDYEKRPPVGSMATIRQATRASVKKFWQRNYRPDNAAIIITGDIVPWRIEQEVVRRFNPLTTDKTMPGIGRSKTQPSLSVDQTAVVYTDPDAGEQRVAINFLSMPNSQGNGAVVFFDVLMFKTISQRIGIMLANSDGCGEVESRYSRLGSGQDIHSIVLPVGQGSYLQCMSVLADAYHKVLSSGLYAVEYEPLQSKYLQLTVDEINRYRTASATDLADRLTAHITSGDALLSAARYETQLLELLSSFDVARHNRRVNELPQRFRIVFSAAGTDGYNLPDEGELIIAAHNPVGVAKPVGNLLKQKPPDAVHEASTPLSSSFSMMESSDSTTRWQLANGLEVILVDDNRYDYVAMAAVARGGYRFENPHLMRAAKLLPQLKARDQFGVSGRYKADESINSELFVNATSHGMLAYSQAYNGVSLLLHGLQNLFSQSVSLKPGYAAFNFVESIPALEEGFWSRRFALSKEPVAVYDNVFQRAYAELFQSPKNFTVVIVGNTNRSEVSRLLKELRFVERFEVGNEVLAATQLGVVSEKKYPLIVHDRVDMAWFHECPVDQSMPESAEYYLRLLSYVVERKSRLEIRERHGLSYDVSAQLLSDEADGGARVHQLSYTVHRENASAAQKLLEGVLNSLVTNGLSQQDLDLAVLREGKRRRLLAHDFLARARELAFEFQRDGRLLKRSMVPFSPPVSLAVANRFAKCFVPTNAAVIASGQAVQPGPAVSLVGQTQGE